MARPKGAKNKTVEPAQGVEDTKETTVKEVKTETPVKEIKALEPEAQPLKNGDLFLLIVNGVPSYWTRVMAITALQRGKHEIEVPKGSPLVLPANSKCKGCG